MVDGHFYFIKDSFYENLSDCNLMANKGNDVEGGGRPCNANKLNIKSCKSKAPNSQSKRKGCFIFYFAFFNALFILSIYCLIACSVAPTLLIP